MDRQTDGRTNGQKDRQIDGLAYRWQTGKWTVRHRDAQTVRWTDSRKDRHTNKEEDRQMDR
jgi:hypothetical protein